MTSVVKLFFYGTVLIISASGEVPHIGPRNAALCAAPISAKEEFRKSHRVALLMLKVVFWMNIGFRF